MKRIPMKYAQLNNPLFLAGINLGTKLDISRRPMTITYYREYGEVHVCINKQIGIVPLTGISDMQPVDMSVFELVEPVIVVKPVEAPKKPVKAQVSSPTAHVFADGPGHVRD